jgi:hypothetical protein
MAHDPGARVGSEDSEDSFLGFFGPVANHNHSGIRPRETSIIRMTRG